MIPIFRSRARRKRELEYEIRAHFEMAVKDRMSRGESRRDAERATRLEFGSVDNVKEDARAAWGGIWIDRFERDIGLALRRFRRAPIFVATVVFTVALAISANAAIFSIIDRVFLRPLPFPEPERLAFVSHGDETSGLRSGIPPSRLLDWSERNSSFIAIAGYFTGNVTDTTGELPELVRRASVSRGFLKVWGIDPALGRDFVVEEHIFGGPASVLISDRYWRERLSSRADVLGQTLMIGEQSVTVVGVMPPGFAVVDADVDLWAPLPVDAPFTTPRGVGFFAGVVGRLRQGVSIDQARLDLQAAQTQLGNEYPETDADLMIAAVSYRDAAVGAFRNSLWLLFGAVLMLVLIASTNIAALLLARAAQRRREMAVHAALGASRFRIAGHVVVETALLVTAGTAVGLLLAYGAVSVLGRYTIDLPTFGPLALDVRVIAYTLLSASVVIFLCGTIPAIRAATSTDSLSRAGRTEVSSRQTLNWMLVGAQAALSVALLTGAGIFLRSFDSLSRVDPGFVGDNVLTFVIHGAFSETNDPVAVLQRMNRTIDELETLPGIETVATANTFPGVSFSNQVSYDFVDWTPPGSGSVLAETRVVSPSYFEALQIPLLSGALCQRPESPTGSLEVMVNRAFAERYFGATSAVGYQLASVARTASAGGESVGRIVGVVGNTREVSLHVDPVPTVYSCYSAPTPVPPFFARVAGNPMSVVEALRMKVAELEPSRPVYEFVPLDRRVSGMYAQSRLRTALLTLFSVAALSLTCVGIYGTLGYVLNLRRREVGLRVALGALRNTIVLHYLSQTLRVVCVACVIGLVLAIFSARFATGLLYGVSPFDALTLASVPGIVLLLAAATAFVPALRASRVDPMSALRDE